VSETTKKKAKRHPPIEPGDVFGRLTVEAEAEWCVRPSGKRERQWLVRCACGAKKTVQQSSLRRGGDRATCQKGACSSLYGVRGEAHPAHGRTGEVNGWWKGDAVT
jgi:hypothetical protein